MSLQFEDFTAASPTLHFYPFIGFNFLDFNPISFYPEEEGRFIMHRPGLHTPAFGLGFRLMCAALN